MKHPLHPLVVHFPVACWSLATFADVASLRFGAPAWRFAGGLHAIACIAALAAIATGFFDFTRLAAGDARAKHVVRHMACVASAFVAYAASLVLRIDAMQLQAPGIAALATSFAGWGLLCAGGWLGGQLVYRHGVNVAGR